MEKTELSEPVGQSTSSCSPSPWVPSMALLPGIGFQGPAGGMTQQSHLHPHVHPLPPTHCQALEAKESHACPAF